MSKNIILCSDGTGNASGKTLGTNVSRLYKALDLRPLELESDLEQVAFYDDGVGTESNKYWKALTGAFGWGLSRNVKQLYMNLARVYKPGDQIYLFGFSRGAFTVRTLAGFICECGIVKRTDPDGKTLTDKELSRSVKQAYKAYRAKYKAALERAFSWLRPTAPKSQQPAENMDKIEIAFIGVWDTVDAVGLPIDEVAEAINTIVHQFKFNRRKLSKQVRKACHALAIDEERHTFYPLLWKEKDEKEPEPGENTRIEQVWFAGVHSNVGGGYPKDELAYVPLNWMIRKAEENGLKFLDVKKDAYKADANPHGKMYDSRSGAAAYYRYKPRDVQEFCDKNDVRPVLHASVLRRIHARQTGYEPTAVLRLSDYDVEDKTPDTPLESKPAERADLAKHAWDFIWWRRCLYFTLMLVIWSVVAALFYLPGHDATIGLPHGEAIGSAVGGLKGQAPSYLQVWVETFQENPGWLLIFLALFALLLVGRIHLKDRTLAASEKAWLRGFDKQTDAWQPSGAQRLAHAIRTKSFAKAVFDTWKRAIPWITLVAAISGAAMAVASLL